MPEVIQPEERNVMSEERAQSLATDGLRTDMLASEIAACERHISAGAGDYRCVVSFSALHSWLTELRLARKEIAAMWEACVWGGDGNNDAECRICGGRGPIIATVKHAGDCPLLPIAAMVFRDGTQPENERRENAAKII